MDKIKVAFVCVHNSCRSQMAEAIAKLKYNDIMIPYSAGTELSRGINPTAVQVIKDLYGMDMTLTQRSKLLDELPEVDIVITMGCNVSCPYVSCKLREDWGLEDPSGKDYKDFVATVNKIEQKLQILSDYCKKNF